MSIINKLFKKKVIADLLKNKDFSVTKESGMNGRTMTEMLGVLAIIGVLSIGGIAGYNYAMDKYRANVTINDINLRAVDLITQAGREIDLNLAEWGRTSTMGYTFSDPVKENDSIYLQISGLPERVCEMVAESLGEQFDLDVNGQQYGDNTSLCGEDNTIRVYFEETGAGVTCNPACGAGEICENGICVDEESQFVSFDDITCSSNAECPECWACGSFSRCDNQWSLEGTSCGNGAGTCKRGVCYLNGCSSDSDCAGDEICGDTNSSCKNRTPAQCRKIKWQVKTITVGGVTERWYVAQQIMSWWDAESACKMVGTGHMATVNELVSGWSSPSNGYFTRTERAQKLNEAIGDSSYVYVWTSDIRSDSCNAFYVDLSSGYVDNADRRGPGFVLCH